MKKKLLFLSVILFFLASGTGVGFVALKYLPLPRRNPAFAKSGASFGQAVLAAATEAPHFIFKVNVPSFFTDSAQFGKDVAISGALTVKGKALLQSGADLNNHDLNLGTGTLTASNVLYGVKAGNGVTISSGQIPTIAVTNTGGVTSLEGQTGALHLTAGSGITLDGLTITNTDPGSSQNIFKTITDGNTTFSAASNDDTLTFAAGSGVTITPDTAKKQLTFTAASALSGLTTNGIVYAPDPTSATSLVPGTLGSILQSNGPGAAPSWVANSGATPSFASLTTGTNTTATMTVGSGATLAYTGAGIVDANQLLGGTWVVPGAIGATTPNTGVFTTLTGTTINGLTITNTGANTLTLAANKTLAVNNTLTFAGTDATSFTLPSASDTLVGRASTDTLTNKTLSAPIISGATTFSSLSTGIAHLDLSGVLSSSAVGLGGTDVAGTLLTAHGGTGLTSFTSGDLLYYASGTSFARLPIGSSNQVLTVSGGVPTWTSNPTGSGSGGTFGYWQLNGSVLSPSTLSNTLSIGTTASLATADIRAISGTLPVASVSGKTSFAALTIDNAGTGDLLTASSSGLSRFTITQNGTVVVGADMTTPTAVTLRAGAATGNNTQGADMTFAASNGTGNGGSGDLIFQTAPAVVSNVTVDAANNTYDGGGLTSSLTWSHTTGSQLNRLLVVAVSVDATHSLNATSGVTYNGTNLTKLDTATCPTTHFSFGCHIEVWYLVNPPSGTHNIVATLASGTSRMSAGSVSYYNVNQATPFGTDVAATGSTSPSSVSVTTDTTQVVFDAQAADNTISSTTGGGTQRWNNSTGAIASAGQDKTGANGSTAMGWNNSSADWAELAVPINVVPNTTPDIFADRLHITSGGNVGIGNSSPLWKLHVTDTQTATATALIENTAAITGNSPTDLVLRLGNDGTNPGTSSRFINFMKGNSTIVGSIQGNGSGGVTYATNGVDFAEYFKKASPEEHLSPGDIVCYKGVGVGRCDRTSAGIVGIVSDRAGFVGGSDHGDDPSYALVGLVGQLPVRIASSSGTIQVGDPLTVDQNGFAVKATHAGQIVGHALESAVPSSEAKTEIQTTVSISWFDSSVMLTADGELADAATQQPLQTTNMVSLPAKQALPSQTPDLSALQQKLAFLSDQVEKLQQSVSVATSSAMQTSRYSDLPPLTGTFADVEQIATLSGSLFVSGKTTLADVGITGTIHSGLLTINGLDTTNGSAAASINTLSAPLKIQPLALAGVDFFNGKIVLNPSGDLTTTGVITAQEVKTQKLTIQTDQQASVSGTLANSVGIVTIPAGTTSIDVHTAALTSKSLIFLTPNQPVSVGYTIKDGSTFTVTIKDAQPRDVKVNWWIIN